MSKSTQNRRQFISSTGKAGMVLAAMPLMAKIRYRQEAQHCLLSAATDDEHVVYFSNPQRAVTPGQYIVFYDKHRCLGGAQILRGIS